MFEKMNDSGFRFYKLFAAVCGLAMLSGCATSSQKVQIFEDVVVLADFEGDELPAEVELLGSTASIVTNNGSRVLKLTIDTPNNSYAGFNLNAPDAWDFSGYEGGLSVAFDAVSLGENTAQFLLVITDQKWQQNTRSIVIRSDKMNGYYSVLSLDDVQNDADENIELNMASGMRSEPPMFNTVEIPLAWMWGTRDLDLTGIKRITLSSMYSPHVKEVLIDNVRIVRNPPTDENYLVDLVDEFGQSAKKEYPGKIHSLKELLVARDAEEEHLTGEPMVNHSKYGGWKNGPKQKATGYFRTEKIDGKWSLVDPEGYVFFATGIDVVRRGDTSTMTGLGFEEIPEVAGEWDLKDSLVTSQLRRDMFEWLPDPDEPLAKHFSFASGLHSGLESEGLSYDFYGANLERKYGADDFEAKWRETTVNRMLDWGFTSFGNWTDPSFYDNGKVAYVANRWITGDSYKRISSGYDFWEKLPDVYDPEYGRVVEETVKDVAAEVDGSPWCIGVFFDNEISWGRPYDNKLTYGIPINVLSMDAAEAPAKAAFTKIIRKKYGRIKKLNIVWGTELASWKEFEKGFDASIRNDEQLEDYKILLEAFAGQYFSLIAGAMDQHMPNHLYLGCRFADWGMPIEAVRGAKKHVDIVSANFYKEGLNPKFWEFMEEIDMPVLIGEFGNGAMDANNYHFGVVAAVDQKDRAKKYTDYMNSVLDNPYFVGAHWFQYLDSAITGRVYDGENYNNGFVGVTDVPYQPIADAAREFNATMYERRYGDLKK